MKSKKLPDPNKEQTFPYSNFPVKIIHYEGDILKTCYFQNEHYAKKYIDRNNFKKSDYQIHKNLKSKK